MTTYLLTWKPAYIITEDQVQFIEDNPALSVQVARCTASHAVWTWSKANISARRENKYARVD